MKNKKNNGRTGSVIFAKHSLGQHFLLDKNITRKIVNQVSDLSLSNIIEIGPGHGTLTRALLEAGAKEVWAIEKDQRLIEPLQLLSKEFSGRLHVIHEDALKIDASSICPEPRQIVSNLPYNVGTELFIRWLHQIHAYQSMTLMFQKEVADRIIAQPFTKQYGRLSVISQFLMHSKKLFDLPPSAFVPPPKVHSSVVQLKPNLIIERIPLLEKIEKITAAGFGNRRKMLRQSLKSLTPHLSEWLKNCDVPETARAEEVSIEKFFLLAKSLT